MKRKIAVAAALALIGSASFAGGPLGTLDDVGANFSSMVAGPGINFDTYTFSLSTLSDVIGGGFFSRNILGVGVELSMGSTWLSQDTNINDGFTFSNLAAGNYTLKFASFGTGAGTYGGNVFATPVPEPETYAMMLAGLAALGFLARRRKG